MRCAGAPRPQVGVSSRARRLSRVEAFRLRRGTAVENRSGRRVERSATSVRPRPRPPGLVQIGGPVDEDSFSVVAVERADRRGRSAARRVPSGEQSRVCVSGARPCSGSDGASTGRRTSSRRPDEQPEDGRRDSIAEASWNRTPEAHDPGAVEEDRIVGLHRNLAIHRHATVVAHEEKGVAKTPWRRASPTKGPAEVRTAAVHAPLRRVARSDRRVAESRGS